MHNSYPFALLAIIIGLVSCHTANVNVLKGYELQCDDSLTHQVIAEMFGHHWFVDFKPSDHRFQIVRTDDLIEQHTSGETSQLLHVSNGDTAFQTFLTVGQDDFASLWYQSYSIIESTEDDLTHYRLISSDTSVEWNIWTKPGSRKLPLFESLEGTPTRIEGRLGSSTFSFEECEFELVRAKNKRTVVLDLDNVYSLIPVVEMANTSVKGKIKEVERGDQKGGLMGTSVEVFQSGELVKTLVTDSTARYSLELPLNYNYTIRFSKEGFVAKSVDLDLRHISMNEWAGGFAMDMDISLFVEQGEADFSRFLEPIGKAKYDAKVNSLMFDFEFTRARTDSVERILNW